MAHRCRCHGRCRHLTLQLEDEVKQTYLLEGFLGSGMLRCILVAGSESRGRVVRADFAREFKVLVPRAGPDRDIRAAVRVSKHLSAAVGVAVVAEVDHGVKFGTAPDILDVDVGGFDLEA